MNARPHLAWLAALPALASGLLAGEAAPAPAAPVPPSFEKASTSDRWRRIQPGMSCADVTALLPPPLIIANGHGYTTWTYDHGGCVLFYADRVVALTLPAPPFRKAASSEKVLPDQQKEDRRSTT